MHLITSDMKEIGNNLLATFCQRFGIDPKVVFLPDMVLPRLPKGSVNDYSHAVDFGVTAWIAHRAQTFLFNTEQVLQFLNSVDRTLPPGDYHAPFENICFQFTQGIDEKIFTTGLKMLGEIDPDDQILGLLLSVPNRDEIENAKYLSVVAWYKSTALNRIQLPIDGNGEIVYAPLNGDGGEERKRDKQRLANLAMLCLAYLTTPGMEIEKISTPEKVNRKRERNGKRKLEDYYICRWTGNKDRQASETRGTGTKHSFRYDVTGHFRRLPDGKTIWIHPHQRGLEHEKYVPKVYKVN